jgi:hypothetical protein
MRKFIIFTPPYNQKSGGVIVLHKLCHELNEMGYEAYLYKSFENIFFSKKNIIIPILKLVRDFFRTLLPFKVNKFFNTPIFSKKTDFNDDYIVIYYEQVYGNPLNAKNVVRWLLHTPGYHTKDVFYGFNEFIIGYDSSLKKFNYPNSFWSPNNLKIIHYPLEYYNNSNILEKRKGTAYCLKKGKHKIITENTKDWILIDNLSHQEISKIFKRVKRFVSYDSYTAYSRFAVLCGCESVVIPDEGMAKCDWYGDIRNTYGLAYGFEDLKFAKETSDLVLSRINEEVAECRDNIDKFCATANEFFNKERYNFYSKPDA